ncbi:ligase-associated DNA damage response endonuclease PdeM [Sphingomonas hankyongi]|uniref:Ligase-associated DNA damage response endonuclease PdeM n=1 Tax=Sphingomonas hankyongi TaxID=2908209 RepID=A0ABT0RZV9_9SPHN|nr:ligase-associated DNA damage response endonuclease PdeM [Sphingomonas hankyongi]MCL6729145.1 ligase-associated DNA damage response endonuclease PdeM [Sphingomonas hankyongi]
MVPFSFASETFLATAEGALFWPERETLLVADLHLEKASWFARLGQFLPPYDSQATLSALAKEVERTGAKRLYCLGDSFHDRFGCERLPRDARSLLTELTTALDWTWIVGNHDPGFADHCGGRLVEEEEVAGIVLRHEAVRGELRPEMSGHFHPKLRLNVKGRHVSRRCFVVSPSKIIFPAFGSLTGGLDAHHPQIIENVGPGASALVPTTDRLLRFPLAA